MDLMKQTEAKNVELGEAKGSGKISILFSSSRKWGRALD